MTFATAVVGAGAAGLVAAIFAAERSPVLVIERTDDGGRKILISGGGRCNILPTALQPERFVTESPPHLVRRMLRSWPLPSQREFFERQVGLPLKFEAATDKWFPASERARDVRDGLIALGRRHGVQFRFGTSVQGISPVAGGWQIETTTGVVQARSVILATGGLSVPATGSDGGGLRLAAKLGHVVHETYPALTPLVATPVTYAALAGVSLDVTVRGSWCGASVQSRGGFLFTHRGYSGPAVLDVSHLAARSRMRGDRPADAATFRVSWSEYDRDGWQRLIAHAPGLLVTIVSQHLPRRLAERLLLDAGIALDRRCAEVRRPERLALLDALTACVLPWSGDEGYKKAEVTGGGVALDQVEARTLQSKLQPGLFLCGEMLDAFGPIGGHNFAWAWSTGRAAGLGAAARAATAS